MDLPPAPGAFALGYGIPVFSGQVRPNTGGMSVAPDQPDNLHPMRRRPAYGGQGKDPVWRVSADMLGTDLQYRQDSPTHGLVEPSRAMSLDEFQAALAQTRTMWKKAP